MKTIEPIITRTHHSGNGIQKIYRFPNGYGASVIRYKIKDYYGSYTNNDKEWELAVIKFKGTEDNSFELNYMTKITGDVMGYLSDEQVQKILKKISKLKK